MGVGKFIAEGKADDVEICQRMFRLKAEQGGVMLSQQRLHVYPRSVDSLGENIGLVIEYFIKYRQCQIGHTYFVYIGESQGNSDWSRTPIFNYAIPFASGVASRLRDIVQYIIEGVHLL